MSVVVFELRARQVAVVDVASGGTEVVTLPDNNAPTQPSIQRQIARQAGRRYMWVEDPANFTDSVREVYQRLAPAPKPTDRCRDCAASSVCAVYQAALQLDIEVAVGSCSAFVSAWSEDD